MNGSSYSLCAKCGNIKPAGSADCSFCGSGDAKSVSLQDLKQGLQSKQPEASTPGQSTPNSPSSAPPADPVDFKFAEPQAAPAQEPVAARVAAAESLPQDSKQVDPALTTQKSDQRQGGFMSWLRRLFGMK